MGNGHHQERQQRGAGAYTHHAEGKGQSLLIGNCFFRFKISTKDILSLSHLKSTFQRLLNIFHLITS